jgi:hypothetical protein
MDTFPPDLGKFASPGYFNAEPPGDPVFALTAGDSGLATSIGQAGGIVSVDPFGGIFLETSSTAFIGIDSLNNISIVTESNQPTAEIEMLGQSTITISSSDGQVKLESVVNDSFISLDLDVDIEARGQLLGGGNVNIANAGTIAFDTLGAGAMTGVQTINGVSYPVAVKQGTFYKSAAQNLTSGNTDITFDLSGAWNNTEGYITHTDGTAAFTVVQTGLYQLEFNAVVLVTNATWSTTLNRTCNIDITRPSIAEQALITSTSLQGIQNYGQSISGTIYLVAGDVINMRLGNTFTSGPPQAQGVQNTFDLNTFFTWRFIS